MKLKPKAIAGLSISVVLAILTFVIQPDMIGMEDVKGVRTLGVLLITIVLLMTETFAIPVTCFICIAFMYLFGATDKF